MRDSTLRKFVMPEWPARRPSRRPACRRAAGRLGNLPSPSLSLRIPFRGHHSPNKYVHTMSDDDDPFSFVLKDVRAAASTSVAAPPTPTDAILSRARALATMPGADLGLVMSKLQDDFGAAALPFRMRVADMLSATRRSAPTSPSPPATFSRRTAPAAIVDDEDEDESPVVTAPARGRSAKAAARAASDSESDSPRAAPRARRKGAASPPSDDEEESGDEDESGDDDDNDEDDDDDDNDGDDETYDDSDVIIVNDSDSDAPTPLAAKKGKASAATRPSAPTRLTEKKKPQAKSAMSTGAGAGAGASAGAGAGVLTAPRGSVRLPSTLPLVLPRAFKARRTMLVQVEDPKFDLSGEWKGATLPPPPASTYPHPPFPRPSQVTLALLVA